MSNLFLLKYIPKFGKISSIQGEYNLLTYILLITFVYQENKTNLFKSDTIHASSYNDNESI